MKPLFIDLLLKASKKLPFESQNHPLCLHIKGAYASDGAFQIKTNLKMHGVISTDAYELKVQKDR